MSFTTRNIAAITGSISGSGTGCAGPIRVWASSPCLAFAAFALSAASPPPPTDLTVAVQGLRNHRGAVRVCLTQRADLYLKCDKDPKRIAKSLPASGAPKVTFGDLVPGTYVLVVLHDENENSKMDTMLKIPKEGFGFSRNPAIRMGPPKYEQVKFTIAPGHNEQVLRLKYLL